MLNLKFFSVHAEPFDEAQDMLVESCMACANERPKTMSKKPPRPFTPGEEKLGTRVIRVMSKLNTWIYRLSNGRLGGRFPSGAPVLLLTTIGRDGLSTDSA